jgi:beta-lactam-binding protein with PASTA domain
MRDFFWRVGEIFSNAFEWVRRLVMEKILPNPADSQETRGLKLTVFLFVGIVGLMLVIGFLTFSLAVRGSEQNLVPNLRGRDLVSAIQDLQAKGLYATVQAQYSNTVEKYQVISQTPSPGTLVKAGGEVSLTVSRGLVIDTVANYVGMNLLDVRSELQTLFSSSSPILLVKDPPIYQPSAAEPSGTILAQSPKPGTKITGITYLQFVVSRPEGEAVAEVGTFVGMSFQEAIDELTRENLPFIFGAQKAAAGQAKGAVISQNPAPKAKLSYGQLVQLVMTIPTTLQKDMIFGIFKYSLPDYPIMVDIRLDVILDTGTVNLLSMKHPGGPLAIPYIVPDGSELVLSVLDKEEVRERAIAFQL